MRRMSIDPTEYVVFDVETNGLKSRQNDLLSISLYKPDDNKEYSKFLPLEKNNKITTTRFNGITDKDLAGATALTQEEFNHIVEEFELDRRTILVYSGREFDQQFLSEYMKNHGLTGFDKLKFYNFKKNIISSRFSTGNLTKDNLCTIFKIEGVQSVHSSVNDCRLEWKLFEKMGGYNYLVTEAAGKNEDIVFRLNENYIIPVSLLSSHPHLSALLCERPYIDCQSTLIKSFEIDARGIEKFGMNTDGIIIEHMIKSMLNAETQYSQEFLKRNKMKLDFIGRIPNGQTVIPILPNSDGTYSAINKEDQPAVTRLNATLLNIKRQILPLIEYIQTEIFENSPLLSQELVVDSDHNILALCDISSPKAVLEIKTNTIDPSGYKEQLFYESRGRNIYYMNMERINDWKTSLPQKMIINIFSVDAHIGEPDSSHWYKGQRERQRADRIDELNKYFSSSDLSLVSFKNVSSPIKVRCNVCEHEWTVRYKTVIQQIPKCPKCNPKLSIEKKEKLSEEERARIRAQDYNERILQKSNHTIVAVNFTGAKENVDAMCTICCHKWCIRADHLLNRCWCPKCKSQKAAKLLL